VSSTDKYVEEPIWLALITENSHCYTCNIDPVWARVPAGFFGASLWPVFCRAWALTYG
jgi:hypothetical protein